jgi:hypothetical protein
VVVVGSCLGRLWLTVAHLEVLAELHCLGILFCLTLFHQILCLLSVTRTNSSPITMPLSRPLVVDGSNIPPYGRVAKYSRKLSDGNALSLSPD